MTLEPEPIPLDLKVVIIGDEMLYHLMYTYDEDFRELFKVRAEFGASIPRDDDCSMLCRLCGRPAKREGCRTLTPLRWRASSTSRRVWPTISTASPRGLPMWPTWCGGGARSRRNDRAGLRG